MARKFARFAELDPRSAEALGFVAIEDWLNDGVALGAEVADECLRGWYGENRPARGGWRLAGDAVRPERIAVPCLVAIPTRDRIVPPASAAALAASLPGATLLRPNGGHVGMVAGGNARQELWTPLAALAAADCCDAKLTLAMRWAIAYIAVNRKLHVASPRRARGGAPSTRSSPGGDAMSEIVIASAARTPVGTFNGGLSSVPAHYLGQVAIQAALERAGVEPGEVSEVVMGQILTAGQGQNPARQASIAAGVPVSVPAWGVNQLCGSGLRAVALGFQAIRQGDSQIVVAGGQESMSQAPHCAHLRDGTKMGDLKMVDTMIKDGLWDAFNGYHMGTTAENVAEKYQITREQQDAFAVASQNKAEAAIKAGRFKDEIVPVTIKTRKGDVVVDTDEHPRFGTTLEMVAKLRPAFARRAASPPATRRASTTAPPPWC